MNNLILQDLFYKVVSDLEFAESSLYDDDLSKIMKCQCDIKRREYISKFRKLLVEDSK